jgi:hypothetical protein
MRFLHSCTTPTSPIDYWFAGLDVPELGRVARLEAEMRRRFGNDPIRRSFPDESGVPEARVGEALEFLDEIDPQPTNQYGMAPIWFWAHSRFRILDPDTGLALPGQDPERFGGVEYEARVPLGTSSLRLILNNRAAIGLELCIPDADADLLGRVVPWLEANLPFKLSPKQWRAWTPTRNGSFKARRTLVASGMPQR